MSLKAFRMCDSTQVREHHLVYLLDISIRIHVGSWMKESKLKLLCIRAADLESCSSKSGLDHFENISAQTASIPRLACSTWKSCKRLISQAKISWWGGCETERPILCAARSGHTAGEKGTILRISRSVRVRSGRWLVFSTRHHTGQWIYKPKHGKDAKPSGRFQMRPALPQKWGRASEEPFWKYLSQKCSFQDAFSLVRLNITKATYAVGEKAGLVRK